MIGLIDSSGHISGVYNLRIKMAAFVLVKYFVVVVVTQSLVFPQHVDIAALLIKYNTCVNATDKWAFTPLHEAAQKGRTQLCALLLAHGADPTMKNQEGQTPLDLATVITIITKSYYSYLTFLLTLNNTRKKMKQICRCVRHTLISQMYYIF